jgi:hypothetical protein
MSELSRETEELLRSGRAGEPMTPEHRARLRAALSTSLALGSVAAVTGSAAAWATTTAKVVGVVLGLGALGTTFVVLQQKPPAQRAPSAEHAAVQKSEQPAPASKPAPPSLAPSPAHSENEANRPSAQPELAPRTRPTGRLPEREPAQPTTLPAQPATHDGHPDSDAGAASSHAAPPSTLAEEARLLKEAHRLTTQGDLRAALGLLDEHSTRFPESVLEPERTAQRILVLCQSGRIAEARDQTHAFLRTHPAGPLATRVRQICEQAP